MELVRRNSATIAIFSAIFFTALYGLGTWLGAEPVGTARAAGVPKPGGMLRVVDVAEPRSLDIVIDRAKPSQRIAAALLERLVGLDALMNIQPGLATSWLQIDDTTWRIKLRPGVKFHNGEPFNAEAVRFSLQRIKDAGTAGAYLTVLTEAIPLDELTVDFKTSSKISAAPMLLTQLWIYPPEYFKKVGADAFGKAPVGTGAFMFDHWEPGRSVTFKRFPDYWGDKALLDGITWKWSVEESARAALLTAGDVDVAANVPPQEVASIRSGRDTKIESIETVRAVIIIFNINADVVRDKRVREAVIRAIDRKSLIEGVLGDAGKATESIYPQALGLDAGHTQRGFPYDPKRSRELLREAGLTEPVPIDFHFSTGRHPLEPELSEALSGMLEQAGFKVNRGAREPGAHQTLFYTQKISGMFLVSNGMTYPHPDQVMRVFFHSKALLRYCNSPELDAKVDKALTLDGNAAANAYHEIETIVLTEMACAIPLYNTVDFHGVRKNVEGLKPRVDEYIDFAGVYFD